MDDDDDTTVHVNGWWLLALACGAAFWTALRLALLRWWAGVW